MRYRYPGAGTLELKPKVGDGTCVPLIRHFIPGLPSHHHWREGESVMATKSILLLGTAIATFENGRYPNRPHGNHAALFLRYQLGPGGVREGFWVADQYTATLRIRVRLLKILGKNASGKYITPSDNASAFSIIN